MAAVVLRLRFDDIHAQVHYVRKLDSDETSSFRFTLTTDPPPLSTWLTTYKLTSSSGR